MTRPDMGNCARCGNPADKSSSGIPECWPCWNWRKLDLPAAQHWHEVAERFLSNVDMYDLMTYLPACGLSQHEMAVMLKAARTVADHSKKVIDGYTAREAAAAKPKPRYAVEKTPAWTTQRPRWGVRDTPTGQWRGPAVDVKAEVQALCAKLNGEVGK